MKVYNYKIILFIICCFATLQSKAAHDKEYTKVIKKYFDMNADGTLEIQNMHGDIEVNMWDKNEVKFEITISADARSESKADDIFDRIEIDFSTDKNYIIAETEYSKNRKWGMTWDWPWNWEDASSPSAKFEIDYVVHVPSQAAIKIENKFGDVSLGEIKQDAEIEMKFGNLKMEDIQGQLDLTLSHGNISYTNSKKTRINLNHASLRAKKMEDLEIESQFSQIYVDEVGDVRSESRNDRYDIGLAKVIKNHGRYDDFIIGTLDKADLDGKYSDFRIEKLLRNGEFEIDHGDLIIRNVASNFDEINIKGDHATIDVRLEGKNYSLDIDAENTTVSYPTEGLTVEDEFSDEDKFRLRGQLGNSGKGKIRIRTEYGRVDVD